MESSSNSSDTSQNTIGDDVSLSLDTPATPQPVSPTPTAPTTNTPYAADVTPVISSPSAISPSVNATPTVMSSDVSPQNATSAPSLTSGSTKRSFKPALLACICLLLLAGVGFGSYVAGKHSVKPMMTPEVTATAMKIPMGATIIEQCEPGLGTQYILPKDIPDGPVYNVYQGKVIGIEYMTPLSQMSKHDLNLNNLPLSNQKFDHINIMTMEAHAGMPELHYQVDVMMVPDSVAKKITCKNNSSSNMQDMSGSGSKQPSSSSGTMSPGSSM